LLAIALAEDDRAEEVVAVLLHRVARIARPVGAQEGFGEIVNQLLGLLLLPAVLALVVVDAVALSFEDLADRASLAVDRLHARSSASVPSAVALRSPSVRPLASFHSIQPLAGRPV